MFVLGENSRLLVRMAALDTAPFFNEDFDVTAWAAEQLGPIPRESSLEQLRNDLGAVQAQLKAELVSTVNRDYAGFVQLSTRIETFNTAILRLKPALVSVQDRLRVTHIALDERLRSLQAILNRRDAVRDARAILQDCVQANELITKIEYILGQIADESDGKAGIDTRCSRFLRLANWMRDVAALVQKRSELPFFILIAPRLQVRLRDLLQEKAWQPARF